MASTSGKKGWQPPTHPRGYVARKVSFPPPIDGRVAGPGWDEAEWTDEFVDIEGPDKPAPYHSTRVKMCWDDDALYIGAWLVEPQPWANLKLHNDIIYKDNDFEVFIDPDGDNHQYYEFEINALNVLWELLLVKPYRDGGPPLMSWESIPPSEPSRTDGPTGWLPLRRAVWVDGAVNDPHTHSNGWGVTLAFPWSLLKQTAHRGCPPKPGDQWRINFSRVQWQVVWDPDKGQYVKQPEDQHEHNWVWTPQYAIAMHQPETWGYLQFADTVTQGEPLPHLRVDTTWLLTSFLMETYKRQKARQESGKDFAQHFSDLGLHVPGELCEHGKVVLQTTEASFLVAGQVWDQGLAKWRRVYVNEEGRRTERCIDAPPPG